jgi:orotate phosphoribosyltransferase
VSSPTSTGPDVTERLTRLGALHTGHFQLSSGRHSDRYVQCALLLSHPEDAEAVGRELADALRDTQPDLVVGPALGGVIIAHEVARALGVPCLFTERKDGEMTLRRGFHVPEGARVVVVEDVVTTGGSVKEVIALLTGMGAEVLAVGSIVARAPTSPFEQRYESLLHLPIESWTAEECPLCKAGGAPTKPGSRPAGNRA